MKKLGVIILAVMLVGFTFTGASAAVIALFDWGVNIDGVSSFPFSGDPIPSGVDNSGFDDFTGLGLIEITVTGVGNHFVGAFFDHEIDEAINTWFNENGTATGMPATGQTWEVDEPGVVFGDIDLNFVSSDETASLLDNFNAVPPGLEEDVSMAMGWNFGLAAGETAAIEFLLATTPPAGGFYLSHTDPDSQTPPNTIYFSSTLNVRGQQIPEPTTMLLLGTGLLGLAVCRRKRFRRTD